MTDEQKTDIVSEALRKARHRRASERSEAARMLAAAPARTAVPELVRLLADRNGRVQASAAEALRIFPGPGGRAALVVALDDADEYVRLYAARSLAQECDPRAKQVLEKALLSDDVDQAGPAMEGLVAYGRAARATFERVLEQPRSSAFLRDMAARALAAIDQGGP